MDCRGERRCGGRLLKAIYEMPGHLVRRFQQVAVAVFQAEASEAGSDLTPVQYAALVTLIENPGIDQATLAGMIAYDRTTIGGVVDRLVQKGLVQREVSDRDRRARSLRVTAEGEATVRALEPAVERAQKLMMRGLSEDETQLLLTLLRKALGAANDLSRAPLRSAGGDPH
jgi:DNA-binding MarR family transcriptional regulator